MSDLSAAYSVLRVTGEQLAAARSDIDEATEMIRLLRHQRDEAEAKLAKIQALFAEDRGTYYGYDDEGYTRWYTFLNLADEVAGLLR